MKNLILILVCAIAQIVNAQSGGNGQVLGNSGKKMDVCVLSLKSFDESGGTTNGTAACSTIDPRGGKKQDFASDTGTPIINGSDGKKRDYVELGVNSGDPIIRTGNGKKNDFTKVGSYDMSEGRHNGTGAGGTVTNGKKQDFCGVFDTGGTAGSTTVGGTQDPSGKKKDFCLNTDSGGTGVSAGSTTSGHGGTIGKKSDFTMV